MALGDKLRKLNPGGVTPDSLMRDGKKALERQEASRAGLRALNPGGISLGTTANRKEAQAEKFAQKRAEKVAQTAAPTVSTPTSAADISALHSSKVEELNRLKQEKRKAQSEIGTPLAVRQNKALDYEKRIQELEREIEGLAGEHYTASSIEGFERLSKDSDAVMSYASAKDVQSDIDRIGAAVAHYSSARGTAEVSEDDLKYIEDKFGLSAEDLVSFARGAESTDPNKRTVSTVMAELNAALSADKGDLSSRGLDYDKLSGFAQRVEDAMAYEEKTAKTAAAAKDRPGGSSLASVIVAPLQGLDYVKMAADTLGRSDAHDLDNYIPANVYNMDVTNFVSTVRGTVASELEKNTDWELFGQNVASFLYQTGMSVADSAAQIATMGSFAMLTMGASAASNQAKNIIERGGSNRQALIGGLAAGTAEALFERVSIDRLLKIRDVHTAKDLLAQAAKQSGVEASEEGLTEIANIITDAAIMADKSEYAELVALYQTPEGGAMTEEDAKKQALLDLIGQVAMSGIGGALSGGVLGGNVSLVNYAKSKAADTLTGQSLQRANLQLDLLAEALTAAPESATYRQAKSIEASINRALENGSNPINAVSNSQWGRLADIASQEKAIPETADAAPTAKPGAAPTAQAQRDFVQEQHPGEKVIGTSAQAFLDAGVPAAEADRRGDILDRVIAGDSVLSNSRIKELKLQDPATRAVFAQLTGVELPAAKTHKELIAAVRAVIDERASSNAARVADAAVAKTVEAMLQERARRAEEAAPTRATEQTPPATRPDQAEQDGYVTMSDGTRLSHDEFVRQYRAENPAGTDAEAEEQYLGALEVNGLGMEYPAFVPGGETPAAGDTRHSAHRAEAGGLKSEAEGTDTSETEKPVERSQEQQVKRETAEDAGLNKAQELTQKVLRGALRKSRIKDVVFVREGTGDDASEAYIEDDVLHINADLMTTGQAIMSVISHELTHGAEEADQAIVSAVLDFAQSYLPSFDLEQRVKEETDFLADMLRARGESEDSIRRQTARELMLGEVAAEVMRNNIFPNTAAMSIMARSSRTAFQRMRDNAERVIARMVFGDPATSEMQMECERLLERMNSALKNTEDARTIGVQEEVRNSAGKEKDERHVSGRAESLREFLERGNAELDRVVEVGERGGAYGYVSVHPSDIPAVCRDAQEELTRFGIDSFVHGGKLEINSRGVTTRVIADAATIWSRVVGLSNGSTIDGRNTAAHEAYHFWKTSTHRDTYTQVVRDNLNFQSASLAKLYDSIDALYFGGQLDITDPQHTRRFYEELVAYITGELHAGGFETELRDMLRDDNAVRRAWQELVSAMAPGYQFEAETRDNEGTPADSEDAFSHARFSAPHRADTDTEEFRSWFHDGNGELRNEDGTPKVLWSGTYRAGWTVPEMEGEGGSIGLWASDRVTAQAYARTKEEFYPLVAKSWGEAMELINEGVIGEVMGMEEAMDEDGNDAYVLVDLDEGEILDIEYDGEEVSGVFSADEEGLEAFNSWYGDFASAVQSGTSRVNRGANGLYGVYMSMKNPLVVNCGGANWNRLDSSMMDMPAELRGEFDSNRENFRWGDGYTTTDDMAMFARDHGYDGIIFKNVLDGSAGRLLPEALRILEEHDNFGAAEASMLVQLIVEHGSIPDKIVGQLTDEEQTVLEGLVNQSNTASNDYVVFDAGQVKSIYNTGSFDPENPDVRYSVSRKQPFAEQVHRALNEGLEENRYNALYIRETPQVLAQVGLGDLPLCMTARHAQEVNSPDGHDIPEGLLARLPVLLATPAAVLDSRTRHGAIVVVTQARDRQGRPVVVTITPNGRARVDGEYGPANFITSVYGRNDFERYIETNMEHDSFLVWNQERMDRIYGYLGKEKGAGQQLSMPGRTNAPGAIAANGSNGTPQSGLPADSSTEIIRDYAGAVKENIPERRFGAPKKKAKMKTGGSTGNINPETGYESGSVADSFMRILNTGDASGALSALEEAVRMLEEEKARLSEEKKTKSVAESFRLKSTEDSIDRNRRVIEQLIAKYGAMDQTSAAEQEVRLPKQIDDKTKVRGFVQTAGAAKSTTEPVMDALRQEILNGTAGTTYVPIRDKTAMQKAEEIKSSKAAFNAGLRDWRGKVAAKALPDKTDIATAEALYVQACAEGNVFEAVKLAGEIAAVGTQAGQVVQAMTLVKKMSPAGKLYYIQKTVDRLNAEDYQVKRGVRLKINEKLAKQLLAAKTKEETDAALDAITQDLADQMPVSVYDKWNTWRYLAMLGNPRTHVRNWVGNAIFTPARLVKDVAAMAMERGFLDKEQRTKGFAGKELRDFAKQDAAQMEDELREGGKYDTRDMIRDKRTIFKTPALDWLAKKNTDLLEREDWLFLKSAYTRALSGYLAAQGYSAADVFGPNSTREGRAALDRGRLYAVGEAKKATFRDASKLAQWMNHSARNTGLLGSVVWGGLAPFTKTPVNIVKRGIEYSPVGLLTAAGKGLRDVRNGELDAAHFIDGLAAGLTGTSIVILGAFLAKAGLLVGGLGDSDEDEFEMLQGNQEYSLRIGDTSYTIDWMSPTALPLFVGEALYRLSEEEGLDFYDYLDAASGLLDPILSLSMLDGLNRTLSAVKYDTGEPLPAILQSIVGSYVSQGVPSVLGALSRTVDDSRRTSFTPSGQGAFERWLNRLWQTSFLGKAPIASENRMAYVDEWGRTDTESSVLIRALENFVSPGYVNPLQETPVEAEISRLAEATGSNTVYPNKAKKTFKVDGEDYIMSQQEYEEHLLYRGQKSYAAVSDLISSEIYAAASDDVKAKAVELAYTYAANMAKLNTAPEYDAEAWAVKLDALASSGADVSAYLVEKAYSLVDDVTITERVLSDDSLSAYDAAEILCMGRTTPKTLSSPTRSGFVYDLDAAAQAEYTRIFHDMYVEAYVDLASSGRLDGLSLANRKEVVSDLGTDIGNRVKREMAGWLSEQGIEPRRAD